MELVYLWVEEYKNIKEQGFNFSPRFKCSYNSDTKELTIDENKDYVNIFPNNINITAIVGENGSGKSNLLKLISKPDHELFIDNKVLFSIYFDSNEQKFFISERKIRLRHFHIEGIESIKSKNKLIFDLSKKNEKKQLLSTISPLEEKDEFNHKLQTVLKQNLILKVLPHKTLIFDKYHYTCEELDNNAILVNNSSFSNYYSSPILDEDTLIQTNAKQKIFILILLSIMHKIKDFINSVSDEELHKIGYKKEFELEEFEEPDGSIIDNLDHKEGYLQREYFFENIVNRVWTYFHKKKYYTNFKWYSLTSKLNISDWQFQYQVFKNNFFLFEDNYKYIIKDFYHAIEPFSNHPKYLKKSLVTRLEIESFISSLHFKDLTYFTNELIHFDQDFNSNRYLNDHYIAKLLVENKILKPNFFNQQSNLSFSDLSGGEKKYITIITSTLYTIVKKFKEYKENLKKLIVILDEPDNELHPQWQKEFLLIFMQSIKLNFPNNKFHIIITSHSPFLVSDLPKQNIIFLDKDENGNCKVVDGLKDKKQTFGANIHTLLSDGFFMQDGLMGEFAKGKIEAIKKFYELTQKLKTRIDTKPRTKQLAQKSFERRKKRFWHIHSIIGEPFLKTIIGNYLDELEQMFDTENYKHNKMQKFIDEFGEDEIKKLLKAKDV